MEQYKNEAKMLRQQLDAQMPGTKPYHPTCRLREVPY